MDTQKLFSDHFAVLGKVKDSFIQSYVASDEANFSFFIILEILGQDLKAESFADSLVDTFRKYYFENNGLPPYEKFENALKYVNDVAVDLQSESLQLFNINMSICALHKNNLYITQANDAEVYLLRGTHFTNVSENLGSRKQIEEGILFENIATGEIQKSDVLVLSSSRLIRYLTGGDVARFFHLNSLEVAIREIEQSISVDLLGRLGVLACKFQQDLLSEAELAEVELAKNLSGVEAVFLKLKIFYRELIVVMKEFKVFLYNFFSGKGIRRNQMKYKKSVLSIVGFLLVLFLLFVLFTTGIFTTRDKKEALLALEDAQTMISKAKSEVDRVKATQLILSAENKIEIVSQIRSLKGKAIELNQSLLDVKSVIDNLVIIENPTVFADISQKRSDVQIFSLNQVLNNYYAVDYERTFEFIGEMVKDPIMVKEDAKVLASSGFLDMESIVYLMENNRIREYGSGLMKFMETDDPAGFKFGSKILTYGSRLYLLDTQEGQIWRYNRKRDSYSKADPALANVDHDKVKNAVDFAIDGSIYVLYPDGFVEKYFRGSKDADFGFASQPLSRIKNASQIYTNANFSFVLILDIESNKIYQFFKDFKTNKLSYMRQYYFSDLNKINAFMVDVSKKRLLVTDGQKVYSTEFLN